MKIIEVTVYTVKVRNEAYLGGQSLAAAVDKRGDYVRSKYYRSKYSVNTESLVVRLVTDSGLVGWGEAQAPLVPEAPAVLIEQLIGPFLIGGDPFDVAKHWNDAYDGMRERGHTTSFMLDAIAACDIALWDLMGKATGLPVHKLLGGCYRNHAACYVSGLPGDSDEARAELARSWAEKGYSSIKLALGYGLRQDLATFSAVRNAVGDGVVLHVDAHWRYTVPEAIQLGRALEPLGLGFLEAPTEPENIRGQIEITHALTPAVAGGEEFRTRWEFRDRFAARAWDISQPDVGRMGITEAMKVASMSEAFGLPIALHLGVGLGVYIAASLQVAAALPNFHSIEFQPTQVEVANRLLSSAIINNQGAYQIPDVPGIGAEFDEDRLLPHCSRRVVIK